MTTATAKTESSATEDRIGFAPHVVLHINKKTQDIAGHTPRYTWQLDDQTQLFIYGDFIALYDGKVFIEPEQAALILKQTYCNDVKRFDELLANSMGIFWAALQSKDSTSVYASVRSGGLFLHETEESVSFHATEQTFFDECLDNGLDDLQLLHYVSNHFAFRSPCKTLLRNTRRMMGGQKVTIKNGALQDSWFLPMDKLCTDERSDTDSLDEFSYLIEEILRREYEYYKNDTTFFEISGGIDSIAFLCAAAKLKLEGTPIHEIKGSFLSEYIERLCGWLKIKKPYYIRPMKVMEDFDASMQELMTNIETVFASGLGHMGISNMYWHPDYARNKPLTFGGHTIGVLYQGHPFMFPAFKKWAPQIFYRNKYQQQPKRYLYTQDYIEQLDNPPSWLSRFFNKDDLPKNAYEYLGNMALTNKLPLKTGDLLPAALQSKEQQYQDMWRDGILEAVLGKKMNDLRNGSLTDLEIAQAMRVIRFATNGQSGALNYYSWCTAGLANIQGPAMQGPMACFLMNKDIRMNEVKNPKNLEFMYMEKVTGKNYWRDFIPHKRIHNLLYKFTSKYRAEMKQLSYRREAMLKEPAYHELVRKYVNPDQSEVLKRLSDPEIKEYVRGLYQKTVDDPGHDFLTVNNLLNLEIFLKSRS